MLEKAKALDVDMIILDLEDSVPEKEKANARHLTESALGSKWRAREVGIRINGLETSLWHDEVIHAVKSSASFVVIPKVEKASQVKAVDSTIRGALEKEKGKDRLAPKIIVAIESPLGLLNAREILASSDLVTAVEFGAEDYSLNLGILSIDRSQNSSLFARSMIVSLARALSIDPMDQAFVGLNDPEGLRQSAVEAKDLGFTGKSAIHPSQIPIINDVFGPSASDIDWAKKVLSAWKVAESKGRAAFRMDDKMVDIVHVRMAERILEIGKLVY
jgi:citrate lyase subunit beta / citryl-CoA lyase